MANRFANSCKLKCGMGATRRGESRGKRSRQPFSVLEWRRSNLKHKRAIGETGKCNRVLTDGGPEQEKKTKWSS